jgi:hypothetical protein
MKLARSLRLAIPLALLAAVLACSDSNDVTGTGGALARLQVDAPDSAVSGQAFNVDARALNVGVQGIHNGVVQITLPAPLFVNSTVASLGTSATFTNGVSGASVTWTLNTLDSNTQSTLRVETVGTLPAGSASQTVRVLASMTADGIAAGDAVAQKDVVLMPQ